MRIKGIKAVTGLLGVGISRRRRHSLARMFRRLMIGCFLAVAGSWLMAGLRMNSLQALFFQNLPGPFSFILEFFAFAMAIFGVLTVLSVYSEFKARLNRLKDLGEQDW